MVISLTEHSLCHANGMCVARDTNAISVPKDKPWARATTNLFRGVLDKALQSWTSNCDVKLRKSSGASVTTQTTVGGRHVFTF
jgi:hypothetical protein